MTLTPLPLSPAEYRKILANDLTSFIQASFYQLNPGNKYVPGPHIEVIADKLEAVRLGKIKRLIINLPPRSLKSHACSVAFPAWLLGHDPTCRIICASYGQDLSDKLARDCRTLMASPLYEGLFGPQLSDRHAAHDFETIMKGGRMATSVGGVLTGRGANIIILDDPLKPDDALSETQRTAVNEWYQNTLLSRLDDKVNGAIIVVMQRLHQDDLVGHILDMEDWEVVQFPAIAEQDEIFTIESVLGTRSWRRLTGEPLHPEREPLALLEKIKDQVGSYVFAAQFQQDPTPLGGALVKTDWLKYYERGSEPAQFGWIVQSWDTANKSEDLNDYSVCTTWGVLGEDIYLLHVLREKLRFPELKHRAVDQYWRFRPNTVIIEDKASGIQLVQELQNQGFRVRPYKVAAGTDKLMRLHAQTTFFEAGRVRLPTEAPWLSDYVAELTGFPGTRHDDQVDSTTQFLDTLRQVKPPMQITEELLAASRQPMPRHRPLLCPMPSKIPVFF